MGDKTALLFAFKNKQQLFKLAVKLGIINLEHKFGRYQRTYLHLAALERDKSLCEFLIKSGANIHALDRENNNILHIAALKENTEELISLFLQKGVDARLLNIEGTTPLRIIQKLTKYAPKAHADLEKADKGLTSLMIDLRLLGLRYSLQGAAFEGAIRSTTYVEVARSLEDYLKNQQDLPPFFLYPS